MTNNKLNTTNMFLIEIKLCQLHPSIIVCRYPMKINQCQWLVLIQTLDLKSDNDIVYHEDVGQRVYFLQKLY